MKKNYIYGVVILAVAALSALAITNIAFAYSFPSTNADNKNQTVPGRVGQDAPYVEQSGSQPGQTTLRFTNNTNSLAVFESRIDGNAQTTGTPHPITGDVIYPTTALDGRGVPSPVVLDKTFAGMSKVEVRLALGGERDWDFDWTSFDIPAPKQTAAGTMPWCSGPLAPGWHVDQPGGGCGDTTKMYIPWKAEYDAPDGTRKTCDMNTGCMVQQ